MSPSETVIAIAVVRTRDHMLGLGKEGGASSSSSSGGSTDPICLRPLM
jgi:hypothetical protein